MAFFKNYGWLLASGVLALNLTACFEVKEDDEEEEEEESDGSDGIGDGGDGTDGADGTDGSDGTDGGDGTDGSDGGGEYSFSGAKVYVEFDSVDDYSAGDYRCVGVFSSTGSPSSTMCDDCDFSLEMTHAYSSVEGSSCRNDYEAMGTWGQLASFTGPEGYAYVYYDGSGGYYDPAWVEYGGSGYYNQYWYYITAFYFDDTLTDVFQTYAIGYLE